MPIETLSEGGSMPGTLTKMDLITAIQTQNGYSLKKSADIVETLLEIIKSTIESGEDVLISGFGKFQVKEKSKRRGRNPATGNDMILPARKVVAFKCSGRLRDHLNGR
jgi:integration host factor subunit alpha